MRKKCQTPFQQFFHSLTCHAMTWHSHKERKYARFDLMMTSITIIIVVVFLTITTSTLLTWLFVLGIFFSTDYATIIAILILYIANLSLLPKNRMPHFNFPQLPLKIKNILQEKNVMFASNRLLQ